MTNINHSYNHCNMDSCNSLLKSLPVSKSKYWHTTWSQIPSAHPCQAQIELWVISSWLFYHIKCLTHNYQVKHCLMSMPQMFPWSRTEYKFLSQNLWICHSFPLLLIRTQSSASVVLGADSNHLKSL